MLHASNFEPLLEAGQKKVGNYNKIQGLRTLIVLTQEDMVCTQDTEEEVRERTTVVKRKDQNNIRHPYIFLMCKATLCNCIITH